MKIKQALIGIFALITIQVYAQSAAFGPLDIGDTIPDELWQLPLQVVGHHDGKETITLADYKGKLIILDFWATRCSSCIAAMPRIHQLEKEHAADMVVIPVSYEATDKVAPFLSTNKTVQPLALFSVVGDETLRATFPHRLIPHYAWISPAGEVGAVTTSERVNAENIQFILDGKPDEISIVREIDPNRPLFLSDVIEIDDLNHYSVFTKGKYDGLPSGNRYRKENGVVRGRALTNSSILSIYKATAFQFFEKNGEKFNSKRLLVDMTDTSRLTSQKTALGGYDNMYNYELIVPIELADSLYYIMLQDLNRYTNYHGRIEKREMKCLILTKTGALDRIKTKGGKQENSLFYGKPPRIINYPTGQLVMRLNDLLDTPLPIVDETGFTKNVDLEFSGELDLETLKKELRAQGLDLVEGYRELNMFVLEDKTR